MTNTPIPPPTRPDGSIPSGTEIYDTIMAGIEPELMNASIPLLEEKYKDESPQDRAARQARYQQAFAEYDAVYKEWHSGLINHVNNARRQSLKSAEARNRTVEEKAMDDLESQMNS